jgi:hypothetical protein
MQVVSQLEIESCSPMKIGIPAFEEATWGAKIACGNGEGGGSGEAFEVVQHRGDRGDNGGWSWEI